MNAEDLRIGEQVQRLDGSYGVVVALRHLFGVAVRYNLTVADDHTYAVGATAVVVHNTCGGSAQSRAEELGNKVTPKDFMRQWATVGVADVQEADGTITRIVSINEKASSTLRGVLKQEIEDGTERFVDYGGKHAEDNILEYANQEGRKLVDIGTSNGICSICKANINGAWPGLLTQLGL